MNRLSKTYLFIIFLSILLSLILYSYDYTFSNPNKIPEHILKRNLQFSGTNCLNAVDISSIIDCYFNSTDKIMKSYFTKNALCDPNTNPRLTEDTSIVSVYILFILFI